MLLKAILPLSLSEIVGYAAECIELLKQCAPAYAPAPQINSSLKIPPVPQDAVAVVRECLRYAEGTVVERLSTLLTRLQVQHGRLRGLFEVATSTTNQLARVDGKLEARIKSPCVTPGYWKREDCCDCGRGGQAEASRFS